MYKHTNIGTRYMQYIIHILCRWENRVGKYVKSLYGHFSCLSLTFTPFFYIFFSKIFIFTLPCKKNVKNDCGIIWLLTMEEKKPTVTSIHTHTHTSIYNIEPLSKYIQTYTNMIWARTVLYCVSSVYIAHWIFNAFWWFGLAWLGVVGPLTGEIVRASRK